jgi:hypothetical protein
MNSEKSARAETPDEDRRQFADVELWLRPAGQYKNSDDEQVIEYEYEELARWSTNAVIEDATDAFDIDAAGEYKIGIRQCGDEQYFQRFSVIEPYAADQTHYIIPNQLAGVMRHWRV